MASPVRVGGWGELTELHKLGGGRGVGLVGGRAELTWPATILVEEWLG